MKTLKPKKSGTTIIGYAGKCSACNKLVVVKHKKGEFVFNCDCGFSLRAKTMKDLINLAQMGGLTSYIYPHNPSEIILKENGNEDYSTKSFNIGNHSNKFQYLVLNKTAFGQFFGYSVILSDNGSWSSIKNEAHEYGLFETIEDARVAIQKFHRRHFKQPKAQVVLCTK